MEDRLTLSYFYGKEADQFSFYKIPKLLFTEEYFKKISVEAKVLYGLHALEKRGFAKGGFEEECLNSI